MSLPVRAKKKCGFLCLCFRFSRPICRRTGRAFWRGAIGQRRCLDGVANLRRLKKRTGEGRARALAAGVRFGRKPKLSDFQRNEALSRRGNGETLAQIARSYAVSVSMISRL